MSNVTSVPRIFAGISALCALTACVGQQDPKLVGSGPSTFGAYETALKDGYRQLAEAELAEFDYRDSDFFVLRALVSDSANPPAPQEVGERELLPERAALLNTARDQLMKNFSPLSKLKAPEELARTQVAFDCWLQEEEEGHQNNDITECRDRFYAALDALETRLAQRSDLVVILPHADGSVGGVEVDDGSRKILLDSALAAVETGTGETRTFEVDQKEVDTRFGAALDAQPVPPRSFTLYFQQNSIILTPQSEPVMREIEADLATRKSPEIMVIGHTDRVGSLSYNDRLSLQRAQAIIGYLTEQGLDPATMTAAGRGERELLVPTANSVDEPRNRRVEISVR